MMNMIERMNHEKSKEGIIEEILQKIQTIQKLKNDSEDHSLFMYYTGYIQAYNDCIDIIRKDKKY